MLQTASEVISFLRSLEEKLSGFYEETAREHAKDTEMWLGFAGENRKYVSQVERAYYDIISDALEGCFAFELDPDDYEITPVPDKDGGYAGVLKKALEMENIIIRFYASAAAQSKPFLAAVPQTLDRIARKRADRLTVIESLLKKR